MGLDLGGQRVPRQAQALHEGAGDGRPVGPGRPHDVGGPRAGGAVDLPQVLGGRDARDLAAEAVGEHRHLLAHGHGRGGLAVRVRQHGDVGARAGQGDEAPVEGPGRGQPHLLGRGLDGEGVGEVVDVLRRAEDVDGLAQAGQARALPERCWRRRQVLADQVLDGLHVVAASSWASRSIWGRPKERGRARR